MNHFLWKLSDQINLKKNSYIIPSAIEGTLHIFSYLLQRYSQR